MPNFPQSFPENVTSISVTVTEDLKCFFGQIQLCRCLQARGDYTQSKL